MVKKTECPILDIDGVSIPIGVIWIHYQRDPFPGGHRYRLRLPEPLASVLGERLGRSISSDTADNSRDYLYWLSSILSELITSDMSGQMETRYVINTVSETKLNEDGSLDLYGVCSPFVGAKR
jgi:hypothetical protein